MAYRYTVIALIILCAAFVGASQIIDPHWFASGGASAFVESLEYWEPAGHSATQVDISEYWEYQGTI